MYLAHYFTFLRIFLIPLFPLVYLEYEWLKISPIFVPYILLAILLVCEFTDFMDGYLARKNNQVSDFGKLFDPIADSIIHISIFFTFTQGWVSLPILLVFVFLFREFIISTLRTLCAVKGVAVGARKSGKIKAVAQASVNFLIIILLIPVTKGMISVALLQKISFWATAMVAVYTIITAVDYVYAHRDYLKKLTL